MADMEEVVNPVRNADETKVMVEEEKQSLRYPNLRFQLFSALFRADKLCCSNPKQFLLYGFIAVSDMSVSREDGWVPASDPTYRYAMLFDRKWYDPLPINYGGYIDSFTNLTHRSVSLSTFLDIFVELFAINEEEDEVYEVADDSIIMNLLDLDEPVDSYINQTFDGDHGNVNLSYIVLTDAVDAYLEITFKTEPDYVVCGKLFSVKILAYYGGGYDYLSSSDEKGYFKVTLLNDNSVSVLENRKIPLKTSMLAVPAKGSLIIEAYFTDYSRRVSINDNFEFPAKLRDSSTGCIEGRDCSSSLELKVNWKYEAAT